MSTEIRLRRHTDGRMALCLPSEHDTGAGWLLIHPDVDDNYPAWGGFGVDADVTSAGWSELFVAELPEPDGWIDAVGTDGEDVRTPYWNTGYWNTGWGTGWGGSITAWTDGIETPVSDLTEDLDAVRSDALKMLAAVATCEKYRAERETQ